MTFNLEFLALNCTSPNGARARAIVGFGSDGSMWFEPQDIGIGPEHGPALARYPGPRLLFNATSRRTYVNALAVVETIADPAARRRWLANVEHTLTQYQCLKQKYDTFRNN